MLSMLLAWAMVFAFVVFPCVSLLMAIAKTIRLWRGATPTSRDPSMTGHVHSLRRQYEAELRAIGVAGLDRDEMKAARDLIKQRYLQRLEMSLGPSPQDHFR